MRLDSPLLRSFGASLMLVLAAACGSSDDGGTTGTGGKGGGGGGGAGGSGGTGGSGGGNGGSGGSSLQCEATTDVDLTGRWAIFFRYHISLETRTGGAIAMCPTDQITSSTMYLLLDIQQNGTEITAQPVNCTLTLPTVQGMVGDCDETSTSLVQVAINAPQALVDSMPKRAMASAKGTLSGSTLTMSDRFAFLTGSSKPVPDMPSWDDSLTGCGIPDMELGHGAQCEPTCVTDCSSLVDDDGDGFPGVTFEVCGTTQEDVTFQTQCNAANPSEAGTTIQGTTFLDFQTDPLITGTVKSSCEVSGTFAATTIYNVVGADLYLSGSKVSVASAIYSLPKYKISSDKSLFRMIRVDGKHGGPNWNLDTSDVGAACKVAIQHQNELGL